MGIADREWRCTLAADRGGRGRLSPPAGRFIGKEALMYLQSVSLITKEPRVCGALEALNRL